MVVGADSEEWLTLQNAPAWRTTPIAERQLTLCRSAGAAAPLLSHVQHRPAAGRRPLGARRGLVRSARALTAPACLFLLGALALPAAAQTAVTVSFGAASYDAYEGDPGTPATVRPPDPAGDRPRGDDLKLRPEGACLLLLLAATTGCAMLMTNGTTQRITVESLPPGARVFVEESYAGETPVDIVVSRRASARVRIEKDGFLPSEHEIKRSPSWWLLLNAPAGWFAGLASVGISGGIDSVSTSRSVGAFAVMATPAAIDFVTGGGFAFPPKIRRELRARRGEVPCGAGPRRGALPAGISSGLIRRIGCTVPFAHRAFLLGGCGQPDESAVERTGLGRLGVGLAAVDEHGALAALVRRAAVVGDVGQDRRNATEIRPGPDHRHQLAEAAPAEDPHAPAETEPEPSPPPPDAAILLSLPGIGTGVLATLLAEGSDALRRRDYDALRSLCGVAPVTRRSGKSLLVVRRLAAHDRLRDAAYHWARVAPHRDPVSRAKYQALRSRGHGHARSLRSVADRLLNVACAMLRDGTCFDPHRAGNVTA